MLMQPGPQTMDMNPLRILIVEDNPHDAELLMHELGRTGIIHTAACVDTREAFLRALEDFRPDIILSDYQMQSFTGMEALRLAGANAPAVPVIIVTGSINEETAVDCMKAGAVDYVLKEHLVRVGPAITGALENKRLRDEKALTEEQLWRNLKRFRLITEHMHDAVWVMDMDRQTTYVNPAMERMLGFTGAELGVMPAEAHLSPASGEIFRKVLDEELNRDRLAPSEGGRARTLELEFSRKDSATLWAEIVVTLLRDRQGAPSGFLMVGRDVTERRLAERQRKLSHDVLTLLNTPSPRAGIIRALLLQIKAAAGCDAVALRLREGDEYPYYEANGFAEDFLAAERTLCAHDAHGAILRDAAGAPLLECLCGAIIAGRAPRDLPFITPGGSFWTNDFAALTAGTTDLSFAVGLRLRCPAAGYASVALIPLSSGAETIGLLQLNDRRTGLFTAETIAFYESIGASIGIALKRMQAEEDLRDNLEFLETLVDTIPNPIFYKDLQGVYRGCNLQFAGEIIGLPKEQIIGKTVFDLPREIPRELAETYHRMDLKLLQKPGFQIYDGAVHCADGVQHEFIFYKATYQDNRGRVAGLVGSMLDISERKRQEALLQSQGTALDQSPIGIAICAMDGAVVYANAAWASMHGWAADEVSGAAVGRFFPPETLEQGIPFRTQLLAQGRIDGPCDHIRRDAARFPTRMIIYPLRDADGAPVKIIIFARDVSEESRLENQLRQMQKMEAVGRLAGGVAHDLNNLLSPIMGYAELLLLDMEPDGRFHGDVKQILVAAERARELVHQLLAFSRKQDLEIRTVNLATVVRDFEQILRRTIREDIQLHIRSAPAEGFVQADAGQIGQILMNLAVNAQDAMPRGGAISIVTSVETLDAAFAESHPGAVPGTYCLLRVSDTGLGMDREVLEHIFEPFYTTKASGRGTGLGLATVYGIAQQHHGYISVSSEPGHGSTFEIYLPCVTPAPEVPAREPAPPPDRPATGTVAVIEDDDVVRRLACRILARAGYTVLSEPDVEAAISRVERHSGPVHLLLVDVIMPHAHGPDVFARLSRSHPETKVLYMSGYDADLTTQQGLPQDGVNFLRKPLSARALTEKVRAVIGG